MKFHNQPKNISFIVENGNPSFPISYNVNFTIRNRSPVDITGEIRDWDGDLLNDAFEIENNLKWNVTDSDADGLMDGLDLAPLWNEIISPDDLKTYQIPLTSSISYIEGKIQIIPTENDFSLNKFPFGKDRLTILPALRIFGSSLGDYLPDSGINSSPDISYIPLSKYYDPDTKSFLSYLGLFTYNTTNLVSQDHVLNLTFQVVWIAVNESGTIQTLIHIFDVQQDFLIQGISVVETTQIEMILAALNKGENAKSTSTLLNLVATIGGFQKIFSNPLYKLEDIPNLMYVSESCNAPSEMNSTQQSAIMKLAISVGGNETTEKYFIRNLLSSQVSHKITTTELFEITWCSIHAIIMLTDILLIELVFKELAVFITQVIRYIGGNTLVAELTQLTFSDFRKSFNAAYLALEEMGSNLLSVSHVVAFVGFIFDLITGVMNFVKASTSIKYSLKIGVMNFISGGLYFLAGILTLYGGFWGIIGGFFCSVAAWIIDAFTPDPEVDPQILEPPFVPFFDTATLKNSISPSESSNLTIGTKIHLGGNQDVKFRARMRYHMLIYNGYYWEKYTSPWGLYNETSTVHPGENVSFSYLNCFSTWGRVTAIEIEYGINVQDVWYDKPSTIPVNFPVYPKDISKFLQPVLDGSWFQARNSKVQLLIQARTQVVEVGEYLDFNVQIFSYTDSPQEYKVNLFKSYGELISLWTEKLEYIPSYSGERWFGWTSRICRIPMTNKFPFITSPLGEVSFGFTLKMPSGCGLDLIGDHHIMVYVQSIEDPNILQFQQVDFSVISTKKYSVGLAPNSDFKIPGENANWAVEIHNIGTIPDAYTLSLTNYGSIDPNWVSLSEDHINLGPCHTGYITITAEIPQNWDIPPGKYLNLKITSQEYPDEIYEHFPLLEILPMHEIWLLNIQQNLSVRPGNPSYFSMNLQNLGNVPETIFCNAILEGFDQSPLTSPTYIEMLPGEAKQGIFQLNAAKNPLLTPGNYTIFILLTNEQGFLLINVSLNLTILDFHDVKLSADPSKIGSSDQPKCIYEDKNYSFTIQVRNSGNVPGWFNFERATHDSQKNPVIFDCSEIFLHPNEMVDIELTVIPQFRGAETIHFITKFLDWNGTLLWANLSITLDVIDEDINPPTIYFIETVPAIITDGEMASNVHYQMVRWTTIDNSDIYKMNASYDGQPALYSTLDELILTIKNITPNGIKSFNIASSANPVLLNVSISSENSLGKYIITDGSLPSFLNYFTLELTLQGGSIYDVEIFRNGEEIPALSWDINQKLHKIFDVAIPKETGTYQFDVILRTYYWVNTYTYYVKEIHIPLYAEVTQVNQSYVTMIPIQTDDPATSKNEGLHQFSVEAIDNDFDLGLLEDRAISTCNRTFQILDDDTAAPTIFLGTTPIEKADLFEGEFYLSTNLTGEPLTIDDQFAQFGVPRIVSWLLEDQSGFSQVQVSYEISGFDGVIYQPETIISNTTDAISAYLMEILLGSFMASLIPGYHIFRVSCTDNDTDWEGDALSNSAEYVLTIQDDDVSPLELTNLTVNSDLLLAGNPMVEVQAYITDPDFACHPSQYQFLLFVDGQWVSDVSVSHELQYDEAEDPPCFQEAVVKFLFKNIWGEQGMIGNHSVEIVTIDNDYDVIHANPDPLYPYKGPNYERYTITQLDEDISFNDFLYNLGYLSLPVSLEGFLMNQTILYYNILHGEAPPHIPSFEFLQLLMYFGFPLMNFTLTDPQGGILTQDTGISRLFSAVLPSCYAAAQLFFVLMQNSILQKFGIPWARFNETSIQMTRGQIDLDSLQIQPTRRPFINGTSLFDGLRLNYCYQHSAGASGTLNVSYLYSGGETFHVIESTHSGDYTTFMSWNVDPRTRKMAQIIPAGPSDGNHTPLWIPTDVALGDTIPIGLFGEKDHSFNISSELIYQLPDFGPIEVWVLSDLDKLGGLVWYEKSTGLLLNGTFYFQEGTQHMTLEFQETNAEFICLPNDHEPLLSVSEVWPAEGDSRTTFNFTVTYLDSDNNPPAYINVVINGTSYPMIKQDPSDRNYLDGCLYQYPTTLNVGTYSYTFECGDWKTHISTDTFSGLTINKGENDSALQLRETLTYIIYPELLYGTSHLFYTLENGTTIFMPTERLTLTYDLATGILLLFQLEHLAPLTDPEDQDALLMEIVLEETNLLEPYEFIFQNQTLPIFVPADAVLKSFFTSFEVRPHHGLTASVTPLTHTIADNETAIYLITIVNTGNVEELLMISLHNLTLGYGLLSGELINPSNGILLLPPNDSIVITLQIIPQHLGSETFSIRVESLGDVQLNATLQSTLTVLDDDAVSPLITNISVNTTLQLVTIQLEVIDSSGVTMVNLTVDQEAVEPLSYSQDDTTHSISLQNEWGMDFGLHMVTITITDQDDDRPNDSLMSIAESTFVITQEDMRHYVLWEIDQLDEAIRAAPDECWTGPVSNRKSAMQDKLTELKELVSTTGSGDRQLIIIDDFNDGILNLTRWTVGNDIPSPVEANGYLTIEDNGVFGTGVIDLSQNYYCIGRRYEASIKIDNLEMGHILNFNLVNITNGIAIGFKFATNGINDIGVCYIGTPYSAVGEQVSIDRTTWHTYGIEILNETSAAFYIDDVHIITLKYSEPFAGSLVLMLASMVEGSDTLTSAMRVDYVAELVSSASIGNYTEAYDKLLHDIKPKLTGLKTNENEDSWGNGAFSNPWITCEELQEEFREVCNQILIHLLMLN